MICALDMYTTLWWVRTGHAVEANSLLRPTFDSHPLTFVLVKCASFLPALLLAVRLAERYKHFTVWCLRAVAFACVGIYLLAVQ